MRKVLVGLCMLAAVALMAPRPADARVSISVGLPGVVVEAPFYGPRFYAPPVYAPRYYAPYYRPRVYYRPHYGYDRGCYRGGRRYDRDRYDRYEGDWDD